ncbi:hypothetical protein ACFVGV_06235 [Pseudarthrobacter scleromae]|uniref:hypothetical protein n=1 Tax=Pseudarthrobacter scleromae TaxID=158897 RepID=UPI0036287014
MPARKVDLDELRRLHAEGWHRDELARHFGVDPNVITKTRRSLGLPLDAPRRSLEAHAPRKVDREEFARLDGQEGGWTLQELASHFGVSLATASRVRRELNLNREHFLRPEKIARIEAHLEDGWSFAEISRTEGVNVETLRRRYPGRAWSCRERDEHTSNVRYFAEKAAKAPYAIPANLYELRRARTA